LGVGIGVTAITNLHVQESNADTVPAVEIEQLSTGDAAIQFSIVDDAYAVGTDSTDGSFKISYAAAAGTAVLGTNTRFTITSAGNIAIGDTESPDATLHIHDGTAGSVSANNQLTVESSGSVAINLLAPDANSSNVIFGGPLSVAGAAITWNPTTSNNLVIATQIAAKFIEFRSGNGVLVGSMTANQNLLIAGSTETNANSGIELQSTTKALLVSRMTTTQRNALSAVNGMIIYNTTTNQMEGRVDGAWTAM